MYIMETKICRECSVIKFIDQFEKDGSYEHKDGTVKTKYKLDCKECRKGCRTKYIKSYGQTHKEELNQKKREWRHKVKQLSTHAELVKLQMIPRMMNTNQHHQTKPNKKNLKSIHFNC